LKEYEPIIGPKICTIQGDIPQRIKDDPGSAQDVLGAYMRISQAGLGQGAAMLVWPETMVPGFLNLAVEDRWRVDSKELNDLSHRCLQALADLARRARARLLVGGQCLALAGRLEQNAELTRFNSAYYIEAKDSEDSVSFLGRYDKVELVPFGEYTPLKRYFPFLARMVPYEVGFSAGRDIAIFDLAGTRFGVLICYEDTIPRLVRRFRLEGAQFLVNISNDGWFEGSMELDAHLAICVFRAVENRVGIVRSVNTGVSGFISPTGKIEGVVSRHGRRKNVEGVLTQNVKLDRRETFYTHYGDWLGRVCMLVMGCLLILCIAVRIKKAIEA
jgi:apolipoprotein N-acyltransferase